MQVIQLPLGFVGRCDEVLACREGHEYRSIQEEAMQTLFNRRSGPIAAAIGITIESPDVTSAYAE